MCYIYASNFVGRMAELADAHALGACGVTHKSSTLFSPTRKSNNSGKDKSVVSNYFLKFVAGHVALTKKCCIVERVCISFKRVLEHWLVLGTNHQTHTYPLLHIFQQYQHIFFKKQMYAPVGRFRNKCNKYSFYGIFYCNKFISAYST